MKKILLIANDSTYVYNLRKELLQEMIAQGYTVHVLCEKKNHTEKLENMGCTLHYMTVNRQGKNPLQDVSLYKCFADTISNISPDVVLTYNIKPNIYAALYCGKKNIPCLVNVCGLGNPVENPGLLQKLTCFLYKQGVKKASCVFFQNTANRDFFIERGMIKENANFVVLPGSGVGLDTHPFKEYPDSDERVNFLYIARLLKEKGIDIFLDCAKTIHEKYPNTMFHICGGCDDSKYLEIVAKAENDGYVKYHGEQRDVAPFFKMCHCFLFPSYYPEGMSNVLLEAAASGRPAIATDRPGCRETVDDGVTGFVVPIKDTEATIKATERFINLSLNEKAAMGKAAREKVEREFDRMIVVGEYLKQIERTLK